MCDNSRMAASVEPDIQPHRRTGGQDHVTVDRLEAFERHAQIVAAGRSRET